MGWGPPTHGAPNRHPSPDVYAAGVPSGRGSLGATCPGNDGCARLRPSASGRFSMKRILAAATAASVLALAAVAAGLGLGSAAAAGPTNTKQPSVAGTPREGLVLTASPGTWTGTGTISYAYQWQRCSSAGTSCANITATGSTYT